MDINHLREFLTVAGYRSISKAAEELHLSQPALSAHISGLEKDLGAKLFFRERPLRLTAAGQKLVERASEIVGIYGKLQDEIHAISHTAEVLAIGYNDTHHAANLNTFAVMSRFVRVYPQIHIQWVPVTEATAVAALKAHAINCVLCNLCPLESDIAAGVAHAKVPASVDNRLYLWVDAEHPLYRKPSLTWADLDGIKLPHSEKNSLLWSSAAHQLFKNHGIRMTDNLRGEDNIAFLQALGSDETQLFDASYLTFPVLALFPNRKLVPIDEDDALNAAYLGYYPETANAAMESLLAFLQAECSHTLG